MAEDFTDLEITWGVRCYNGAFDSRTDAMHRKQARALAEVRKVVPELSITYFPVEGKYMAFNKYKEISDWFLTRGSAIAAMYQRFCIDKEVL